MTAAEELYVRDGSRFVRLEEAPRIPEHPPIPVPMRVVHEEDVREKPAQDWDPNAVPTAENPIVRVGSAEFRVYAPKCPHGSFVNYARNNCCKKK